MRKVGAVTQYGPWLLPIRAGLLSLRHNWHARHSQRAASR